jgi:hypothetical protein
MHPVVANGSLNFGILGRKEETISSEVYAIYHGRFVEMLLAHFDDQFSAAKTSAKLVPPDQSQP